MATLWFCLVAGMIAAYVIFDGFDIGTGAIHKLVAKTEEERGLVMRSIGPVWDGNEVWLLAAGGTLYFAFPKLYASSFSGFYLPLMMVLWLLILRALSIELRGQLEGPIWRPFWDVTFMGSSALLAIFFGAALGNVVRGVPLDENGVFFEPLWTNFLPGANAGILDWYTVLVGVAALVTLAMHGGLWLVLKTEGALQARARRVAGFAMIAVLATTVLVTIATLFLQPQVGHNLRTMPWGYVFPALALGGLGAAAYYTNKGRELAAFLGSTAHIAGMLTSAAFGLYPYVLPASTVKSYGLTASGVAAAEYGLKVGLVWWIPGMLLVAAYFVYTYRSFGGKVQPGDGDGH